MKRKYLTEFGLHVLHTHTMLLYPADLKTFEFDKNRKYHIYMVHKTPKITIDPLSIKVEKRYITLDLEINNGNNKTVEKIEVYINEKFDHTSLTVSSEYPYNRLTLFKENEVDIIIRSLVLHNKFSPKTLDLEVLYVGQSFGSRGERKAYDRLLSHSTLQEVLSDINLNEPDKDAILSLWEFDDIRLITTMDGLSKDYGTTDEVDNEHFMEVLRHETEYKQVINIVEAALIYYFKPMYNEKYKNNFPTSEHKTYLDYYNLDFNALCIELFPETLKARLYSASDEYKTWEFIQYELNPKDIRKSMYDIFR